MDATVIDIDVSAAGLSWKGCAMSGADEMTKFISELVHSRVPDASANSVVAVIVAPFMFMSLSAVVVPTRSARAYHAGIAAKKGIDY